MRYFFYTDGTSGLKSTVIIIDENSPTIRLFPDHLHGFSKRKQDWLGFYDARKKHKSDIFEICENQYKKFVEKGIKPEDWDW